MKKKSLEELNIAKEKSQSALLFKKALKKLGYNSFVQIEYKHPQEYVRDLWNAYRDIRDTVDKKKINTLNGNVFELIISTLLYRESIKPFYLQANVAFVPNVNYDIIIFSQQSPVSLSLKTSLRERYKQADLEAIALKYVHRKAKCFLLTLNEEEADNVKKKICKGEIIGLDQIVDCTSQDLEKLIDELKRIDFSESITVEVVEGQLVK